jgi:hypothetical protein
MIKILDTEVEYIPSTNVSFPFDYGFVAGFDFDGSFAYVGYTEYIYCPFYSTHLAPPTRVSTNAKNPGAFMECSNSTYGYEIQNISNATIYIIQKTKNMSWKRTTVAGAPNVIGIKKWSDRVNQVTYGRYQMSNWTMFGKVRLFLKLEEYFYLNLMLFNRL